MLFSCCLSLCFSSINIHKFFAKKLKHLKSSKIEIESTNSPQEPRTSPLRYRNYSLGFKLKVLNFLETIGSGNVTHTANEFRITRVLVRQWRDQRENLAIQSDKSQSFRVAKRVHFKKLSNS